MHMYQAHAVAVIVRKYNCVATTAARCCLGSLPADVVPKPLLLSPFVLHEDLNTKDVVEIFSMLVWLLVPKNSKLAGLLADCKMCPS